MQEEPSPFHESQQKQASMPSNAILFPQRSRLKKTHTSWYAFASALSSMSFCTSSSVNSLCNFLIAVFPVLRLSNTAFCLLATSISDSCEHQTKNNRSMILPKNRRNRPKTKKIQSNSTKFTKNKITRITNHPRT
jgi:hypothetical protein